MPYGSTFRLSLALLAVGLAPAAAADQPAVPPPGVAGPERSEGTGPRSFEDSVAAFVADYYLSGEVRGDEETARLYADTVDYFDNRSWDRARVLADKRAYYARWPLRRYRLLRETLKVAPRLGRVKVYDVSFEYEFAVSGPARQSRGRGRGLLTLDLASEGGRITRETGIVLARW